MSRENLRSNRLLVVSLFQTPNVQHKPCKGPTLLQATEREMPILIALSIATRYEFLQSLCKRNDMRIFDDSVVIARQRMNLHMRGNYLSPAHATIPYGS